jgi:hypothetical protein
MGTRYRVKTAIQAIRVRHGRHLPMTVLHDNVAQVDRLPNENRLIEVEWEGQRLMISARDLREHCEPLDGAGN